MNGPSTLRRCVAALAALLAGGAHAQATPDEAERVQITDPYIELHTGPGRGYPVFHVVERAQSIAITLRRTEWFLVRTDDGKVGWVHRSQLVTTLTATGDVKRFRDPGLDDYLQRRGDVGGALGRFKGEPYAKLWAGYRLAEVISVEGGLGEVQGVFSGTTLWHVGLNAEPWADKRLAPFFGVGLGKFNNIPNAVLVNAQNTNAKLGYAMAGLRWHLTSRFVLRADYSIYTAFVADNRNAEYRAVTAGISFYY